MQRPPPASYSLWTGGSLLVAGLIVLQFFGSRETLEFTRSGILDGELWRVFSGHTIHLSWQHLGVNVAGLVVCQFFFGLPIRHLLGLALSAALVISGGLLLLTSYDYYLGLSGILHAWLVAGAIFTLSTAQENKMRLISWTVILLLLGKIGIEQFQTHIAGDPSTMEQFIGSPIVIEAHWMGLFAGATYTVLLVITGIRTVVRRAGT